MLSSDLSSAPTASHFAQTFPPRRTDSKKRFQEPRKMEVWTILLGTILLILVYFYRDFKKKANFFVDHGVPTVKSLPFFGSMAPCILGVRCFAELLRDFYNSVPGDSRYVGFMDFTKPTIIVRDVDLINEITTKNFDHFVDHQAFGDIVVDPLFANFLFSMEGDKWHALRATLTPSFTTLKIKFMFQLMKECAEEFSETMESRCHDAPVYFDAKDVFSKVANDIIVTTAFGVSVNSTKDPNNDFYSKGHHFTETGYFRLMKFFLARTPLGIRVVRFFKLSIVPEEIQNFFRKIIASNIHQRKTQGLVRKDMIHLLMEAKFGEEKRELTLDEITAQAVIFYFGGFDTVSTGLSYTAYLLAKNPHIQEKLQAEIDKIYEQSGGNVSYEDLQQFKYLDAVIHEATRLFPPFAQTDRVCTKRYELPPALPGLKPLVIEPGTVLYLSLLSVHRDEKYFPKPEEFIPERFLTENGQVKEPPGYLTFGRGPRLCIANRFALVEMKVVLFNLLLRTNLKLCDKTIHPARFCQATAQYNPVDPTILSMESRKRAK